jgi:hypothetical protein
MTSQDSPAVNTSGQTAIVILLRFTDAWGNKKSFAVLAFPFTQVQG